MNERPHLVPCLIACVLLLAALGKWPYGYYMLVRVVTCGTAAYVAYFSYENRVIWAAWVFGIMVVVFNPIFQFHFGKEGWQMFDVIAAVLFLVAIVAIKKTAVAKDAKNHPEP